GRFELLDQQRNAIRLAGENQAAGGLKLFLLRNFSVADLVVDIGGCVRFTIGQESLGAQLTTLGNGIANGALCVRQGGSQRLGGGGVADLSQRDGRGRRHTLVLIFDLAGELPDRACIAADSDRVD